MTTIVNDNKLNLILTTHGKNRIAQAMADSTVRIEITKIKIGSGLNNEYYVPSETDTDLKGPLGLEFPVIEKALLEDGQTVSFYSIISENIGGFDIREVGLYENYNGVDTLFAISTQQPFVKPSIDYNYLISLNYYMFLKAENVSSVYDQIVLNAENVVVTQPDLEDMMSNVLFAHANLVDQIQQNSTIIGYNRPTQLLGLINTNQTNFSYLTTYKNYSTIINYVDPQNVMAYWVFDYSRHGNLMNKIPDISNNRTNLSLNTSLSTLESSYSGFQHYFNISTPNYFSLSTDVPFSLLNGTQTSDASFTMAFVLEPNDFNTKKTLLARSNASLENSKVFEVFELPDKSIQVILYADNENYLSFNTTSNVIPSNGFHSVIITYNHTLKEMSCFISGQQYLMTKTEVGNYTHMNSLLSTIYAFSCIPEHTIYANADTQGTVTNLYNEDGTSYEITPTSDWQVENSSITYKGYEASYSPQNNIESPTYYAWTYDDSGILHTIYTTVDVIEENTTLYEISQNMDITEAPSDTEFSIHTQGEGYVIQYINHNTFADTANNIPSRTLFAWDYIESKQTIYTNNSQYPTLLFEENGNPYTGSNWYIKNNKIFFNKTEATYNPTLNKVLSILEVGSYITNASGQKEFPIDSKVGLVAVLKEELATTQARTISLLLESTLGKNPCISGGN